MRIIADTFFVVQTIAPIPVGIKDLLSSLKDLIMPVLGLFVFLISKG